MIRRAKRQTARVFRNGRAYLRLLFPKRAAAVQPGAFLTGRANFVFGIFFLCFFLLGARAITIHLFSPASKNLSKIADQQYNRELSLARYRGTIYDRRREPLAISIRMPSIFVNPRVFQPSAEQARKLSIILQVKEKKIFDMQKKKSYFAWLQRKVSHDIGERVAALNIPGLYQVTEPARYYPAGAAAGNLLGYVGLDDKGLMGIEQQFEQPLAGPPIKIIQSKDARGNTIFSQSADAAPEKTGDNIYLTIDKAIQEISEIALRQGIIAAKAVSGFAIVSDPHTGRILALANYPTIDPNNARNVNISNTKNKALMDAFEPGSVLKPIVAAIAMAEGKTSEQHGYDCEGGVLKIGNRVIHDDHKPEKQFLTTAEIVVHSSNVGIYKIAQTVGMEGVHTGLQNFGFGQNAASLNFPGEAVGSIAHWSRWIPVRFANIAFGHGLMTTGLELVQAYGALANGGNLMQPLYLDRVEASDGSVKTIHAAKPLRRVMTPQLAKKVRLILQRTVEEAATKAAMDDYTAGGKTGTAQKIDPVTKAYSHTKHLASFIGITPIQDPHLVIYVQIDEPHQNQHYGALWAAPVFKDIAEKTLKYLNVLPDKSKVVANLEQKTSVKTRHH